MRRTTLVLGLALVVVPAIAGAQQDSTRRDSTGRGGRSEQARGGEVSRSRSSANRFRGRNYGLDREQITQLQQAINDRTDCDAGTPDGLVGPRTRRALSCARRELNVSANDMGALFAALNLDFAGAEDAQGNAGNRENRGDRERRGNAGNRGRDSTPRDSTQRDSTQRNSTRQPPR